MIGARLHNRTGQLILVMAIGFCINPASHSFAATAEVKSLVTQLANPNWQVRVKAAVALGKMGADAKSAVSKLAQLAKNDKKEVRAAALWALGTLGPVAEAASEALQVLVAGKDSREVRRYAASALARITNPDIATVVEALWDSDDRVRTVALVALERVGADPDSLGGKAVELVQENLLDGGSNFGKNLLENAKERGQEELENKGYQVLGTILGFRKSEKRRQKEAASSVHVQMAAAYQQAGMLEPAMAHYAQAVKLHPKSAAAYSGVGAAFEEQGDHKKALGAYVQALKLDPNLIQTRLNLAGLLEKEKQYEHAKTFYKQIYDILPKKFEAELGMARCDAKLRPRFRDNVNKVKALADSHPKHKGAQAAAAEALEAIGDRAEAAKYYLKAYAMERRNPRYLLKSAWAQSRGRRRGGYWDVKEAFLRVLRLDPSSQSAHTGVFQAYRSMDQRDKGLPHALSSWELGGWGFIRDEDYEEALGLRKDLPASLVLGQKNMAVTILSAGKAGSGTLNKATAMSSDGTRLFLADSMNHRILCWNKLPTAPGQPPDFVLGQTSFSVSKLNSGQAVHAKGLKNPNGVFTDGKSLYVADTHNHRVLVYNSIPSSGVARPDLVLGQTSFVGYKENQGGAPTGSTLRYPWGIYKEGKRLYIADSGNNRVLVFTEPVTQNGQVANLVLGQSDFSGHRADRGGSAGAETLDYPTDVLRKGRYVFVADSQNNRVLGFDIIFLTKDYAKIERTARLVLGQADFTHTEPNQGLPKYNGARANTFNNPNFLASDRDYLYVCDSHNNRISVFNTQTLLSRSPAAFVYGQENLIHNDINRKGAPGPSSLFWPTGLCTGENKLFVSDKGNNRVLSYPAIAPLPEESDS